MGFSGSSNGKESACSVGDLGLNPGSGRSPGEGYGYPLQYSCLEDPMDRGAWQATVPGVTESGTTGQLTLSLSPSDWPTRAYVPKLSQEGMGWRGRRGSQSPLLSAP